MKRSRRLRRRLFWAAVLLGLVLVYATALLIQACLWACDVVRKHRVHTSADNQGG